MSSYLLYEGRHGERILIPKSREAWDYLINELEQDNNMTLDEAREQDFWIDGGTYEEGCISVDDGGSISTIELTEIN